MLRCPFRANGLNRSRGREFGAAGGGSTDAVARWKCPVLRAVVNLTQDSSIPMTVRRNGAFCVMIRKVVPRPQHHDSYCQIPLHDEVQSEMR
jgi:hypothetical protein